MALAAGTRLGSYEITASIGAGGMGEVYRARDTRLDRTVAVKVLPSHLAADPDAKARFDREAKAIAALNHPHICTLHDVGHDQGVDFLVMELVDGETLANRLQRRPLPLDEALKVAIQIADALDKAHRQGVVHRDLKPANIVLTNSGAKLLDFGLARLKTTPGASGFTAVSTQAPLTGAGTILGTLTYMSPEQVEGREIDHRSDIFSFGCVVYEMVTGRRAFAGDSAASVIAAILDAHPPDIRTQQPLAPVGLDHIVKTCLAKDPERRWQSARDVAIELDRIDTNPQPELIAPVPISRRRRAIIVAGVLGLIAGGGVIAILLSGMRSQTSTPAVRVTRSALTLPSDISLRSGMSSSVVLSPDGSRLAFVAVRGLSRGADPEVGGEGQLYLRALDELNEDPLAGTEGACCPFFSPDGQWIGFFANGKIKKVAITGGAPQTICDAGGFRGGTWGSDDTIVFSPSGTSGLFQVAAAGGTPQPLTTLDAEKREKSHRFPSFLPRGKAVLFTITSADMASFDEAQVALVSVDTGERRVLFDGGTQPRYLATGHVAYVRGTSIFAAPFDLNQLAVTGQPVAVLEGVSTSAQFAAADLSISQGGSLAYVRGGLRESDRRLVWVDREGRVEPAVDIQRTFFDVRLSPDGSQLAIVIGGNNDHLWLYDLTRRALTRLTFDRDNISPDWTPDGKRITFSSNRAAVRSSTRIAQMNLFWVDSDGSAQAERFVEGSHNATVGSWSADAGTFAFGELRAAEYDIFAVSKASGGARTGRPLIQTPFNELYPRFSPDARWLAYVSDESGQWEVYVRPFPSLGAKWQVSTGGGSMPRWDASGRELFYQNGARMMAVPIRIGETFSPGVPRALFEGPYLGQAFDVSRDGRFLMIQTGSSEVPSRELTLVQNWFSELKGRIH